MASMAGRNATVRFGRWSATTEAVRDVLLIGLAVSSGAIDAISWLGLGKIFAAFQTGNFVFLGIDIAGAAGPSGWSVLISLAAFGAGVALAVPIVKATRGSGLWPRRVSTTLGVAALAEAAFFVVWLAISGDPSTSETRLLIGLWALAMGFQSAAIMSLGVASVFTTAVTATFIGLISDLAGWSHPENQERRFTGVLFGLLVGAVAGAWLFLHANDVAPLLPLIVLMLVIAAAEYAMKPAR